MDVAARHRSFDPVKLSKEGLTMKNRNLAVWMAVVTVVALVLASLNIASQGPLPYVHDYQVHIAPAWA